MENKEYHHGNLRNALIEAGIQIISTEGETQFSLRKVASLCGVSHAAPYSHFKDKEELQAAMQMHVVHQLTTQMQSLIDSYEDKTKPQLMIELGKCYFVFFMHSPHYFSFLFSQSCWRANLDIAADNSEGFPPFELFKVTAIPIFRATGITEERMEDAIISTWAHVHGLVAIASMKNIHYSKNWEDKIVDFLSNEPN